MCQRHYVLCKPTMGHSVVAGELFFELQEEQDTCTLKCLSQDEQ